ncbi:glycoside hydrolase superfamily [Aspergillus bertholletiae]|uniref:Glycoside hydrolase superfamily n=1 Tax=Aspergillus bertholletiae TaxID=1226010 RepID=A0A5N7BPR2_9EURO|nr:glycoside hydrolase superfamily [Aspergillus bertholletiae]
MHLRGFLSALAVLPFSIASVTSPGDTAVIPGWHLQSALHAPKNLTDLSLPTAQDVSSWYRVGSRATVMAGLIQNDVYNDTYLFYSNNLAYVDHAIFNTPWLYREELSLRTPPKGQHMFLVTHGITSKADIYFNGKQIASNEAQQGAYGGHRYDITPFVQTGKNVLLIQAHPTNYLRDFAQGFVDWNPYPPDNGTGVWRDVELKQTGPVSMSAPRILTDFTGLPTESVTATIKVDIENHENHIASGAVQGTVRDKDGSSQPVAFSKQFKLEPHSSATVSIDVLLSNPKIWWPAAWGEQPLYTVQAKTIVGQNETSDVAPQTQFGIRHVTSKLNSHNDTQFSINGHPFHVRGGGYSPDMFLRFDLDYLQNIFRYMLDMGLNTIRLEGKQEHPELYELADRMGMMVMAGWECCDKWEGWDYNDEAEGVKWTEKDYPVAEAIMLHEGAMMQAHPSMLTFLIGSDFWPNDRATELYVNALNRMDWPNPIIASASKRGYPELLGPSGMKMDGPYDWVPPNYWYHDKLGAAYGFGSELGPGVGTPELGSLKEFMSPKELDDLWMKPDEPQWHMSRNNSPFAHRSLYNKGLFKRYGQPTSLEEYLRKSHIMDYEGTRAEFESYAIRQNASRPATGVIYWMLNGAWPSLHWQLFDHYLRPAGSYFGTKVGTREEHVAYDYEAHTVHIINHSLDKVGQRTINIDLIDLDGESIAHQTITANTTPTASKEVATVPEITSIEDVAFLRLTLEDTEKGTTLSRNVYWLSPDTETFDWDKSNFYTTPVTKYTDLTALDDLDDAEVSTTIKTTVSERGSTLAEITLENESDVPAFFIHLMVADGEERELAPVYWSDNYVTLFPEEKITLTVEFVGEEWVATLVGANVEEQEIGRS